MEKKLPGVFPGKVKKDSGNNKKVFYSNKENSDKEDVVEEVSDKSINQKINAIFNSPSYIYKADVEIKLKNETVNKRVVGRNSTHLITMENELIPISEILDIKKVDQ